MASGKYRKRITIERFKDIPITDAHGEVDKTDSRNWETYADRSAEIQTKGGREFWKVDKVESEVSHLIRVQYDNVTAGITSAMRIKLDSRTVNIVASYDVDEMREVIEMQCKEPK